MVSTSNWPPLVAMSVVTRWRSTFSSSTTQFSAMPLDFSKSFDRRCMMIMSALLTVAMVSFCCAIAEADDSSSASAPAPARALHIFQGMVASSGCSSKAASVRGLALFRPEAYAVSGGGA